MSRLDALLPLLLLPFGFAACATAPEDSARAPMERAMKAVIGFDDSDAKRLEAKKAEHAKRALGGLAVFFGGSG